MRGYAAIGLVNPKSHINVGSALRACQVFGASLLITTGRRYERACTDTMAAYRHMPFIAGATDLWQHIPFDCAPVAVERNDGSCPLPRFVHPRSAIYIFGPEDGAVPSKLAAKCAYRVVIPAGCLNLAAAVNVVLYDRMAKESKA